MSKELFKKMKALMADGLTKKEAYKKATKPPRARTAKPKKKDKED